MDQKHQVVIVGGGSGGISVAARLKKAGITDIAVIEPSDTHYYQPLWTLVGGGRANAPDSARPMASVIPAGVTWIKDSVTAVDPEAHTVSTSGGKTIGYDRLVVAAGIQLDWDGIPGLSEALGRDGLSSNYRYDLAPVTWQNVQKTTSGNAIFHMPPNPIKCAGAPQKIAYLACDYWREQGVLGTVNPIMVLPTPGMFGVKVWSDVLVDVAAGYGIDVRLNSVITEIDPANHTATIKNNETGETETLEYSFAHMTPPQSAPDWIKNSPLADPESPMGYVGVNKHTLQHNVYPDVFALGDCTTTPNSKTGAAIRKQAPVLVENLVASLKGSQGSGSYDGYASCPIVTSNHDMLLAEFDYDFNLKPSFPVLDPTRPHRPYWYLKKYGLPFMYWNLMLRGVA